MATKTELIETIKPLLPAGVLLVEESNMQDLTAVLEFVQSAQQSAEAIAKLDEVKAELAKKQSELEEAQNNAVQLNAELAKKGVTKAATEIEVDGAKYVLNHGVSVKNDADEYITLTVDELSKEENIGVVKSLIESGSGAITKVEEAK